MSARINPHSSILLLILTAFVMLSLATSLVIPLGEAPDEVSHYGYMDALVRTGTLPRAEGAAMGAAHHPPLYYTLVGIATAWVPRETLDVIANPDFEFSNPDTPNLLLHPRREAFPYQGHALAWHLVRLLSVVMGCVTILATWLTARILLPDTRLALGATAFVAFLPGFISMSAVVNNDNLITMLAALAILQLVRYLHGSTSWQDAAVLGVLLGASALTKLSGLTLWLFAACIFGWLLWQTRFRSSVVRGAIITLTVAGCIAAPFYIYNTVTWGDPLAWSFILQVTPARQAGITMQDLTVILNTLYTSFWGRFGGALHLPLPTLLYLAFGILALAAITGWVLLASDSRKGKLDSNVREALVLCLLFWGLMLIAFVRWTLAVSGTDHARQLFPGLPLLAIALTAGFARLFGRRVLLAMGVWSGSFFLSALIFLWAVATSFAPAPLQDGSVVQSAAPTRDFGGVLGLSAFEVSPTQLKPGESLRVITRWRALEPPQENYWLFLQLQKGGEGITHKEGIPGAGRTTTDWWQTGQEFSSTHVVQVPEDAEPGTYSLQIGVHPFQRWEWVHVDGQELTHLANITISEP